MFFTLTYSLGSQRNPPTQPLSASDVMAPSRIPTPLCATATTCVRMVSWRALWPAPAPSSSTPSPVTASGQTVLEEMAVSIRTEVSGLSVFAGLL